MTNKQHIVTANDHVLCVQDVGFDVANKAVLRSVSHKFLAKGVTGLIGPNGSGKSTLMKLLARQQPPSHGTIILADRPLRDWGDRELARRVAYLPQETATASGLKVRELVAMGRYPWHGAVGRFGPEDQSQVDQAMTLTETIDFADRAVDTLSGGERQRVWLAMLIAQNARLLLLDEPISALDVAHQIGVLKLIRQLSQERNFAVVVIIHEVNLATRFCDQIVAMKDGEIAAVGPPLEFMNAERLHEIYDVRMGLLETPETGALIAYALDE